MKNTLPEDLLSRFSEFIGDRIALHFPRSRWIDLERMVRSASKEFGSSDPEEFIERLISSPLTRAQMDILASHMTNGETYFWREPRVFEALVEHILPELVRSRELGEKRLRIWSAGCSTGEEPYSIAIALSRVLPTLDDWNITILATDINPQIMRKAALGLFGEWSFRNAPAWLKEGYFRLKKSGKYEILPEIRKMVTFAYLNLAQDIYPSPLNGTNAMDLIFCRNVLMYFSPEHAGRIGRSMYHALVDGGWLIVGASELSQLLFPQFASVNFPGAITYRKGSSPQPEADFHLGAAFIQEPFVQQFLEPAAEVEWPAPPAEFSANDSKAQDSSSLHAIHTPIENLADMAQPTIALSVRILADQGKLADALSMCEKAIAVDKLDPELQYLQAIILQELNREVEAIASLKRALYLDPNFVLAYFTMGNLALRHGDAETGRRCFENALALLNTSPEEEILPESDGLTVGRLRDIIHADMRIGALA